MRRLRQAARTAALLCGCVLGACDAGGGNAGAPADSLAGADLERPGSGRDTIPTGRASVAHGCAIVEEGAVERTLGFDVVMNDNTTGNCVLTPASGQPTAPAFDLRIEPRTAAFDYFSAQPDATPVPDLGDRAVWATLNDMTGYLVVVRDTASIVVAIAKADGITPDSRRQAERLARLLLR